MASICESQLICSNSESEDKYADGYDCDTINNVPNDYYCLICLKLMRNVKQMECGHVMCKGCLQRYADALKERQEDFFCPVDRKKVDLDRTISVPFIDRLISESKVQCHNECGWTGDLGNLKDHTDKCRFSAEKCTNKGCNEYLLPIKLKEHLESCKYNTIACPFFNYGCQAKVIVVDVEAHLEAQAKNHVTLVKSAFQQLRRQHVELASDLTESQILVTQLVNDNQRLQDENNSLSVDASKLTKANAESKDLVTQLKKKNQKLRDDKKIDKTLITKLTETNNKNNNSITQLEMKNYSLHKEIKKNEEQKNKEEERCKCYISKLEKISILILVLSRFTVISKGFIIVTLLLCLYLCYVIIGKPF